MAPFPEVRSLPGDVLRRSPERPPAVFDSLLCYLKGLSGADQIERGAVCVTSIVEHDSWLEVDVMLDFMMLRAAVRVFQDDASTVVCFSDLLGQDTIRFSKFVRLVDQVVLRGVSATLPNFYVDFDDEIFDDELAELAELAEQERLDTAVALMKSCAESQKSALDSAQILASWAHAARAPPQTHATIAKAAAEQEVVRALAQSKQTGLPQLLPLLAALQRSAGVSAEDLALLERKTCVRGVALRSLPNLPNLRQKLGDPYCCKEGLPKAPKAASDSESGTDGTDGTDGTATASPISLQSETLSQNRRSGSEVLSSD